MSNPVLILEATRDREAVGRGVLRTAAAFVVCGALAIFQLGAAAVPAAAPQREGGNHRLVIPAAANGHCYVDGWIGGARFRNALLDSGASGYLTIGKNQAKEVGLNLDHLSFSGTYQSSNGEGRYATVRVASVRIADAFQVRDVPVDITAAPQKTMLIGIQILHMFNLRVRGEHCELSWSP